MAQERTNGYQRRTRCERTRADCAGESILAADESLPTVARRFQSSGIPSTEVTRRAYRALRARFAKWRAVSVIGAGRPKRYCT